MASWTGPEPWLADGSHFMTTYDVFLSHNDADRAAVAAVAAKLVEAGLRPFLDRWHLVPGESFMPALEKALEDSRAVAVFFGPAGVSAWEDEEKQLALALVTEARRRGRRVIPVILPGGRHEDVAGFIRLRTWVDLAEEDGILRLVAGIEGRAPGPPTKRVGSRRPSGVARDQVAGKTDGEPPGARRGGDPGTPKQRHADRVSHEDGRPPIARQTSAKPATYRISILHISDLHARSLEVEELPEEVRHQRRGQVRREAASRARVLGEAWGATSVRSSLEVSGPTWSVLRAMSPTGDCAPSTVLPAAGCSSSCRFSVFIGRGFSGSGQSRRAASRISR